MKLRGRKGEFYFHTLGPLGRLSHGDGRTPKVGEWLKARRMVENSWGHYRNYGMVTQPEECEPGMHACKQFAGTRIWGYPHEGMFLCVVQLKGKVRHFENHKSVALERKIVAKRRVGVAITWAEVQGLRSEDVARWVMNPKLSWPKRRK